MNVVNMLTQGNIYIESNFLTKSDAYLCKTVSRRFVNAGLTGSFHKLMLTSYFVTPTLITGQDNELRIAVS